MEKFFCKKCERESLVSMSLDNIIYVVFDNDLNDLLHGRQCKKVVGKALVICPYCDYQHGINIDLER